MEHPSTNYTDLITRYFHNETTGDENAMLADWLKQDAENRKLFKEYQKSWEIFERSRIDQMDVDAGWEKLSGQLDRQLPREKSFFIRYTRVIRMAAILLLLLIPAFFITFYIVHPRSLTLDASSCIAESKLPDGTSVTLNTGSFLTYPSRFSSRERNVNLSGEAWFEVAHDRNKPFIISNGNVRIKVLGTSFYVNTNKSTADIEVILTGGNVALYYKDRPSSQVFLEPGEKAEIMKEQEKISKSSNDDENFLAWKTRIFVFNDDTLRDIVRTLNKVYHADIRLADSGVSNCRITATFNKQSLESILNVLKSTVNLTVKTKGPVIEISGEGCN